MKETATVLEKSTGDSTVLLQFHEQEGCKSCKSLFCKANERTFTAVNNTGMSLQPGDIVTVYLPPGKTVQASFLLLIAPLILFFLFYIFSQKVIGIHSELVKVGIGFAGLATGFLISYFITKRKKQANMPEVIAKNNYKE